MKRNGFTMVEMMITVLLLAIVALIAVPNFLTARTDAESRQCIANMKQIEGGKAQWQLDTGAVATLAPTQNQLLAYMRTWPVCPKGGTYAIGTMLVRPTCSFGTPHILP